MKIQTILRKFLIGVSLYFFVRSLGSEFLGFGVEGGCQTPIMPPQLQKFTPVECGRHQRHLANSGGWVPIKGEPGTPYLPLTCPRACWDGTEGSTLGPGAPYGFRPLIAPHTHACSHRIQL